MNIRSLQPLNIAEEKEKFFADFSYNPQFRYAQAVNPEELSKWGHPEKKLEELALRILEKYPQELPGEPATERAVSEAFTSFVNQLPEMHVSLTFSPNQLVRAKYGQSTLTLHTPVRYKQFEVQGMLNHELGTHALRSFNQKVQTWDPGVRNEQFRRTEEGLAVLNTQIVNPPQTWRRTALSYLSVCRSLKSSFVEVFNFLSKYVSRQKAWRLSVRAKRGLTDTGLPGGLTKDLSYLSGVVEVYSWIKKGNNPQNLYIGRVSTSEVPLFLGQSENYILPPFAREEEKYLAKIHESIALLSLEDYV